MDVALKIDALCPAAQYGGSTSSNTEAEFDTLRWEDARPKPTWAELLADTTIERAILRARVSREYDEQCATGFAVTVDWSVDPLTIRDTESNPDVKLLSGVLATAGALATLGQVTATTPVVTYYTFANGVVRTGIQFAQLAQLNMAYQQVRSARYQAHKAVKDALDAGAMPVQADYEACGLTLDDFEGMALT